MSLLRRLFLFCLLLLVSACSSLPQRQEFELVHVVDGDSLFLRALECPEEECPKTEIRLLGLDAPEYSQDPWGLEAREFLLTTLEAAEHIYIETDIEERDKYKRLLGYLFVERQGRVFLVNEMILDQGHALLFHIEPNSKYLTRLKAAEARAKTKRVNIWDRQEGLDLSPYKYRQQQKKLKGNNGDKK